MYRFYVDDPANEYHYAELCRIFLEDDDFEIINTEYLPDREMLREGSFVLGSRSSSGRDAIKREIYEILSAETGIEPKWGTLTGVRPLKPALNAFKEVGNNSDMKRVLRERYLLSDSKQELLSKIASYQISHLEGDPSEYVSVYTGIPFCPTRCEYCSFASNTAETGAVERYVNDLLKEIEYTGNLYRAYQKPVESIYIGGGTPTTLTEVQLKIIIKTISSSFEVKPCDTEFTVEAGRPDTINEAKLEALKDAGVSRISINPQSMKDKTLGLIGRKHTSKDVRDAFALAHKIGFAVINADLIAGLPEENLEDFIDSLDEMIELGADNITIHTLSVKRGSRLYENDPGYYRRDTERVSEMLDYSEKKLGICSYHPYYIYRQKHQMGAFENVGYCKEGKHSLYNIRIMEDRQSIIALGAGAVGKIYYPDEDRIERIANVSNYEIYSERLSEMLARKNKFFGG